MTTFNNISSITNILSKFKNNTSNQMGSMKTMFATNVTDAQRKAGQNGAELEAWASNMTKSLFKGGKIYDDSNFQICKLRTKMISIYNNGTISATSRVLQTTSASLTLFSEHPYYTSFTHTMIASFAIMAFSLFAILF